VALATIAAIRTTTTLRYHMRKPKRNDEMKTTVMTATRKDFFARGKEVAKSVSAGKSLSKQRIISFEDMGKLPKRLNMKIDYDEKEDVLFIRFRDEPVIKDVSYGWNVNVGITEHGIGQITILDAEADGLLPLQISKKVLEHQVKAIRKTER
jgi:uncharacterized protein YuzE